MFTKKVWTRAEIRRARLEVQGDDPVWTWSGVVRGCHVCGAPIELTVDQLNDDGSPPPPRTIVCATCDAFGYGD